MRRDNGRSLDAEPVTPQTATPDFALTRQQLLAEDFDPTELRALFGEDHCKKIVGWLREAGVSASTLSQPNQQTQLNTRPISKTA